MVFPREEKVLVPRRYWSLPQRVSGSVLSRVVGLGLLLLASFVLGLAFQKYQFFPYRPLINAVDAVREVARKADPSRGGIIKRQYVLDGDHVSVGRNVDSILLPLRLTGLRVSEEHEFPKGAGSITVVGSAAVVLDRLGNAYAFRAGASAVEKLALPLLPSEIEKYVASASFGGLDDRKFRAHHALFLPSLNALAVSHSYFDESIQWTRLAVSLISIDKDTLQPAGNWKTVYLSDREPFGAYEGSGGAMLWREPHQLFLSLGDRPVKGGAAARIVEVDLEDGNSHIVTTGHRNTTAMTVLEDGRVICVDQGPYGGDELNVVTEGANYGWPNVSLGTAYGSYQFNPKSRTGSHVGYAEPIYAWLPSVGVSDVLQVANFDPLWNGDLLVSSLKGLSLFRLRISDGHVQYSERIYIGQRIRDIDQLQDGTIVLWTDDAQLLFLEVDDEKLATGVRVMGDDWDAIGTQCLFCHHFGPTNAADFAPSLSGVLGRRIASDNFRYSAGLRGVEGVWTEKALRQFLADPGKFAPGTSMPNRNLSETDLDEIIETLAEASSLKSP